jgi:ATP-dependent Lon protease
VEEKLEIAKRHLVPKQTSENGLKKSQLKLTDKTLEFIIETYTAESGVRGLEKTISKLARGVAVHIAKGEEAPKITEEYIVKVLGPSHIKSKYQGNDIAGVVTGLAWTQVGGDILFIETSLSKNKNPKLTLTGNLGDVMKESAVLALEYLKAHPNIFDINPETFDEYNVHIHVPEGATPKDGPSAGIAMLTSMASAFTRRKVKKALAMTGEITLRGKVLPVGGIKEKLLAAKRAEDVTDIKQEYLKGLTFHYVTEMEDVLRIALLKEKVKVVTAPPVL